MTPEQAGLAVAAKAYSQRGIHYSSKYSKYGAWFHSNFAYSLWCAMFASWCFAQALGVTNAVRLLGRQYSWSTGHASTVTMLSAVRAIGGQFVRFEDARAGDLMFWKFPGTTRSLNIVNHVDVVYGRYRDGFVPVVGGNTTAPGSYGDPSAGRGVWLHSRSRTYYNSYGVYVLRPAYSKFFSEPKPSYAPRTIPLGFGYGKTAVLARVIQDIVNRRETGTLNSGDISAVKALQKSLSLKADGFFGPATARAYLASKGTLRQGSRGDAVRLWQYIVGIDSTQLDGVFGAATASYTKKAQTWGKVTADGIVGKNTLNAVVK